MFVWSIALFLALSLAKYLPLEFLRTNMLPVETEDAVILALLSGLVFLYKYLRLYLWHGAGRLGFLIVGAMVLLCWSLARFNYGIPNWSLQTAVISVFVLVLSLNTFLTFRGHDRAAKLLLPLWSLFVLSAFQYSHGAGNWVWDLSVGVGLAIIAAWFSAAMIFPDPAPALQRDQPPTST
jgi:hypothetical protein